jgi:hypothetical protein
MMTTAAMAKINGKPMTGWFGSSPMIDIGLINKPEVLDGKSVEFRAKIRKIDCSKDAISAELGDPNERDGKCLVLMKLLRTSISKEKFEQAEQLSVGNAIDVEGRMRLLQRQPCIEIEVSDYQKPNRRGLFSLDI